MAPGHGIDRFNDFSFGTDVIFVDAAFGFADAEAVIATISKPFTNVSRLNLDEETALDIFHDSQSGTPLTSEDIAFFGQESAKNQAPVANSDTATTISDQAITIDVLANDSDADGDALSIQSPGNPANGTVSVTTTDEIRYTPDARFSGTDDFTYTVSDGNSGTDTAMVTIEVTEEPSEDLPPIGENDDFKFVQHTSPGVLGAGAGDDTYVLSSGMLNGSEEITISDGLGNNLVQLASGLEIAESTVAANALQLALDNGSEITVLGADEFRYEAGSNPITGDSATDVDFSTLVSETLGVQVPASGTVTGDPVTIGETQVDNGDVAPMQLAGVADASIVDAAID